jgi:neurotransmitter:Na+ symporter, NSS family
MSEKNEQFSSRWGLLLSSLGMAVGTGNIWRFPRIAAANGGGSFLVPWLIFMFAWSLPLIFVEFALGRHTRRGPAGAIGSLIGERYNWMGVFVGACTALITFYYSVVTGWCLKYFVASLGPGLVSAEPGSYWHAFTENAFQPVVFHFLAMAIGCLIIYRGVVQGIERTNRVLVPVLFILLAGAAARAVMLPGAERGLYFLFAPVWGDLINYRVWLEALTQSAWSTGAGWGLITTFGVYLGRRDRFVGVGYATAIGDYVASLLAGIAVMCTVFGVLPEIQAREALGSGNTGLTFIWLPQLFRQIPGGRLFLPVFFLTLSCAAISSLIAQLELCARMVMDLGLRRERAVPLVGALTFLLGLPSAWSLDFFNNQDWVWGLGLMVSGFFVAFAVIKFGAGAFRDRLINPDEPRPLGRWFVYAIAVLIPVEFVALLAWWFYQAATVYDPAGWWNPFHTLSVGTCVFQWGILIALLLLTKKAWNARLRKVAAEPGGEA